jgi:hypothetical protein
MRNARGRRLIAGIAVALLVGQAGCARSVRVPRLAIARLGAMGVVAGPSAATLTYQAPPRGAAAGARQGLARGFGEALGSGDIFLALGAPIFAGIRAVDGAATARSVEEVDRAEQGLRAAFAGIRIAEVVRDRAGSYLEARTGRPAAILPGDGPGTATDLPDGAEPAAANVQTVLEVSVPAVGLRDVGPTVGNPDFQFAMVVRVRVTDAVTGRELFRGRLPHVGAVTKFGDWGADDARRFREEIRRAADAVAWEIVDDLFCAGAAGAACPSR